MPFAPHKHTSSAKVVDGSLVLSLPDALSPVVMRLSLEEAKSAALGVEDRDGKFFLVVKFSENEGRDIAPYETREKAVSALMAASTALEKGSSRPVLASAAYDHSSHGAPKSSGNALKWAGALGVLALLAYFIYALSTDLPQAPAPRSAADNAGATATMPRGPNAGNSTGVPVTADDFLSRRQ